MTFRVGQKVVCVDAASVGAYMPSGMKAERFDLGGLTVGAVYTIRDVGLLLDVVVCRLEKIYRPTEPFNGEEAFFAQARFRPIVEPKTEISFTAGADPSSDQFDNRRKVRKKVAI